MNEAYGTQQAITNELPAILAEQILTAMRTGSLEDLQDGLERATTLAEKRPFAAPATCAFRRCAEDQVEEQLELLGAVAGEIRHSILRYGRQLSPHLEGMEVHLQLLKHLATATPSAA